MQIFFSMLRIRSTVVPVGRAPEIYTYALNYGIASSIAEIGVSRGGELGPRARLEPYQSHSVYTSDTVRDPIPCCV